MEIKQNGKIPSLDVKHIRKSKELRMESKVYRNEILSNLPCQLIVHLQLIIKLQHIDFTLKELSLFVLRNSLIRS